MHFTSSCAVRQHSTEGMTNQLPIVPTSWGARKSDFCACAHLPQMNDVIRLQRVTGAALAETWAARLSSHACQGTFRKMRVMHETHATAKRTLLVSRQHHCELHCGYVNSYERCELLLRAEYPLQAQLRSGRPELDSAVQLSLIHI